MLQPAGIAACLAAVYDIHIQPELFMRSCVSCAGVVAFKPLRQAAVILPSNAHANIALLLLLLLFGLLCCPAVCPRGTYESCSSA
jgi:hypothetical protein